MAEMMQFSSYAELGRRVKQDNPKLTRSDEEVGLWYARKHPERVRVGAPEAGPAAAPDAEQGFFSDLSGFARFGQGLAQSIPGPVDVAQRLMGAVGIPDFGAGVASGASLGSTELLRDILGGESPEGLSFSAGEIVGEIIGPYKLIGRALNPAFASMKAARPQVGRILQGGIESAGVEMGKGLVDQGKLTGENPFERGAVGFVASVVPEAAVRGVARGVRAGAQKMFAVLPADLNQKYIDFAQKHGLPVIPSIAAPYSPLRAEAEERIRQSSSNLGRLRRMQEKIEQHAVALRNKFLAASGPEDVIKPPTEVGGAIVQSVQNEQERLYKEASDIYQGLINSSDEIKNLPINAAEDITRVIDEQGTTETFNIMQKFEELVGTVREVDAPQLKRLHQMYERLKKSHARVVSKEVVERPDRSYRMDVEFGPSGGVGGEAAPLKRAVVGGERNIHVLQEEALEHMTYAEWWGELRAIGRMLDQPAVRKNTALYRDISKLYHYVQDGIDYQAMRINPNYEEAIKEGRSLWMLYRRYRDNPIIDKVLDMGGVVAPGKKPRVPQFSQIANALFKDVEHIRAAKGVLPPEVFQSARQAWLRDILWESVELADDNTIKRIDSGKLVTKLHKYVDGLDSEAIQEIFSDEGFSDVLGNAVPLQGNGAQLYDQFKEIVRLAVTVDISTGRLNPGQEGFSQSMAERFAFGPIVADPIANVGRLRGLVANLLLAGKMGEKWLAPMEKNPFLGADAIPEMRRGALWGMSGRDRQAMQAAVTNRLLGND